MKKGLFYVAALSGALLTACTDHSDLYDSNYAQKQYESTWEQIMGNINPNQTWNTAASRSADVSVNYGTDKAYKIKVYTSDPHNAVAKNYLLAEYALEDGQSKTIRFDAPSALKRVYVACVDAEGNSIVEAVEAKEGMKADFSLNAAASRASGDQPETIEIPASECNQFLSVIPEKKDNRGKTAQDFVYLWADEFSIYPVYAVTGADNVVLGLYYYDADGTTKYEQDLWGTKDGKLEYAYEKRKWPETEEYWESWSVSSQTPFDQAKEYGREITKLKGKGYKITLSRGTKFGFYVKNDTEQFYTEAALNIDKKSHAATFTIDANGEDHLYLGFEDWRARDGYDTDWDFNDVVCYISDTHPIVVNKDEAEHIESMEYRIAYEDLGGTNDFDFNDVVLGVKHVSGTEKATVRLLAAGGTLPVSVKYGNEVLFNEVHEAFGVETGVMVNTGYTEVAEIPEKTIAVDDECLMADCASKFKLGVTDAANNTNYTISVPDESGKAPQAFVVANPEWEWPEERQRITEKYEGFGKWASDLAIDNWYGAIWDGNGNDHWNGSEDVYPNIDGDKLNVEIGETTTIPAEAFTGLTEEGMITIKTTGKVAVKGYITGSETPCFDTSIDAAGLLEFTSLDGWITSLEESGLTLTIDTPENVEGIYLKE